MSMVGRVFVVALALAAGACTPFGYVRHEPPRVFVWHEPLHPRPGESVTIRARAELRPGTSGSIHLTFTSAFSRSRSEDCEEAECTLGPIAIPSGTSPQSAFYGASLTVASRSFAGGLFTFHIGEPAGVDPLILRAPVGDRVAYKVAVVRDRDSFASDAPVWAAAQRAIYEGIFADPVYRWRDDSLGFYYVRTPGVTRDYYSGLTSRCGQDPWAGMAFRPPPVEADAIAVVHNRADYRDCSGLGGGATGTTRNFHVHAENPQNWKHELGHAAFGLSDEYTESTENRRAAPRAPVTPPAECNCCRPDGTVGGGGCLGRPLCPTNLPPECFPAAPVCPPLGSTCVYPNVFATEAECRAAALAINAHPGVEERAAPKNCRLLCRGNCPCGTPAELWVHDADDDVMAGGSDRHGPACARCIETTLCVLWETRRTGNAAAARRHCGVAG